MCIQLISSRTFRHIKNCDYNSVWFIRISPCPFWAKKCSPNKQRFINHVLHGFCFAYIDDVLVASSSYEEHIQHLETIFKRFSDYIIIINPIKYLFGQSKVIFFGHKINAADISPLPDKTEAINIFKAPITMKQLRQFLGMVNFYWRFLLNCAQILHLLADILTDIKN